MKEDMNEQNEGTAVILRMTSGDRGLRNSVTNRDGPDLEQKFQARSPFRIHIFEFLTPVLQNLTVFANKIF